MKKTDIGFLTFTLVFLGVGSSAFGQEELLLEKTIGGLAQSSGLSTTCRVYSNNPAVLQLSRKIHEVITAAAKEPVKTANHVQAQVPSKEYYAFQKMVKKPGGSEPETTIEKVLLSVDYGHIDFREGVETRSLIKLLDQICK
jgi:hypothetical protein